MTSRSLGSCKCHIISPPNKYDFSKESVVFLYEMFMVGSGVSTDAINTNLLTRKNIIQKLSNIFYIHGVCFYFTNKHTINTG